jgi:hypothetical protein
MLDVKECIEINNAVLTKSHVNGFFTNVGQGKRGRENDLKDPSGQLKLPAAFHISTTRATGLIHSLI